MMRELSPEEVSFEEFWIRNEGALTASVRYTGEYRLSFQDIEDIVSDVKRKSLEKWQTRKERSERATYGWCKTIADNTTFDHLRRTQNIRKHSAVELDDPEKNSFIQQLMAPDQDIVAWMEDQEVSAELANAIQQLLPKFRPYVVLIIEHYYYDQSLKDIAEKYGVPYETVKKRHQRALEKLYDLLK